jgi:Spy/CpxP family protein refolding chaperone
MDRMIAVAVLGCAFALGFSATAFAQPGVWKGPLEIDEGRRTPGGAFYHRPMEWLQGLELTEEQQDQVFKIVYDRAPSLREQLKILRRSREELDKLVVAPTFDAARARELAETGAKAAVEITLIRAEAVSRIRQVLTSEQRSKLDQKQLRKKQQ